MLKKNINVLSCKIFKKSHENLLQLQEKVLMNKLKNSYGTMLSKKYDFESISSIADYQKRIPIHHYNDINKFWQFEIEGTQGATLKEKIKYFALSTGTTGKQKLVPVSKILLNDNRKNEIFILLQYVKSHPFSSLLVNKKLGISGCAFLAKTPSGAHYGMISGIMAMTAPFLLKMNLIPKKSTINIGNWNDKATAIAMEAKGQKVGCIFGIASSIVRFLKKTKEIYSKKEFEFFTRHLEVFFLSGVNYRIYKNDILELIFLNTLGVLSFKYYSLAFSIRCGVAGGLALELDNQLIFTIDRW